MTEQVRLRRYHLPSLTHGGWGTFVIGSDGYFSAVTDYGNYAYRWSSTGCADFREFLLELEHSPDYLAKKLSPEKSQVHDREKTARNILREICELRRSRELTKDEAREERELAQELLRGEIDFRAWHEVTDLTEPYEVEQFSMDSGLEHFCTKLYPRLCALLHHELAYNIEF